MTSLTRILAQGRWETRLLLRNGEQLLLTIVIPLGLLVVLVLTDVLPQTTGRDTIAASLATVLAVSVISTGFTSLAIATGFERRSGALRLLATTPLTSRELLFGKAGATVVVTALSGGLATLLAVILGWRPTPSALVVPVLVLLGVAAWAPWAFVLAGSLRAEGVLAVANGLFLVFLLFGGVVIPAASLPDLLGTVVPYLPSGALVEALAASLGGTSVPAMAAGVLLAWSALGTLVATRTFRWT